MLLVTLQAWFWEAWTSRRILWQANGPVDLLGNFEAEQQALSGKMMVDFEKALFKKWWVF